MDPTDDVQRLWEEFHLTVNMNSRELRDWLLTEASDQEAFPDADLTMPEPGRVVLGILGKRRMDLTDDDLQVMAEVVQRVRELLANRPATGAADQRWRHELMNLGHDPVRAPRTAEQVPVPGGPGGEG